MRTRGAALIISIVLVTAGCAWPQWGGSAEHRGSNLVFGLTKASVTGWVEHKVADLSTSGPIVTGNGLAFVVQDGRLVAFDPATDAIVWDGVLPAGSTAGSAPAISSDGASSTIFVIVSGTTNPILVGFDVDGVRNCNPVSNMCSPVFTAEIGSTVGPATPVLVHGERVFVNGADTLNAFDANAQTGCTSRLGLSTCTPLWSAPIGSSANGIGPTATSNGVIYDPGTAGAGFVLRAFNENNGSLLWTGALGSAAATATPSIGGDGKVFVPAGALIQVFGGAGCGAPSCVPSFALVKRLRDLAGDFLATPAFSGSLVYSTNANGMIFAWPSGGCGAAKCRSSFDTVVNAPAGGSSGYRQSPVLAGGIVFVLAQRSISGGTHVLLIALDEVNGRELATWDFGVAGFGEGLANASIAGGVVYAPIAGAVFAVHPKPVRPLASLSTSPLALSPAFDPSIFDYVIRCAAGTNSVTLTMTATPGGSVGIVAPATTVPTPAQTATVALTPNQAAVVKATDAQAGSAEYWIRCLPPDFPAISVTTHTDVGTPTPGWYVLGNNLTSNGSQFAMILDTNGTPVWYKRSGATAVNVTPIARDAVAFMPNMLGVGFGRNPDGRYDAYSLATNAVQSIRTVGVPTDFHELQTLPNGNRLLLSYAFKGGVDLTGLAVTPTPGPNSTIADCIVQEVDSQGQLIWEWTASDHLDPVTEPTNPSSETIGVQTVYDVFHCNSIDPKPSGDLLVSARNISAVFEIRRADGQIVWKMGGKPTNKDGAAIVEVRDDPQASFALQHDARYLPDGRISLYDNQAALPARGIEYAVDLTTNTARPVFSFASPESLASCCMGSFRSYPDGHRVIGWGFILFSPRAVTELDANGNSVLEIAFAPGNASYRAVKVPPPFYTVDILRSRAGQ